jgi:hypothetical protein
VGLGQVGRAVALITVTNIDNLVLLALFFGRAAGRAGEWCSVSTRLYRNLGLGLAILIQGGAFGIEAAE